MALHFFQIIFSDNISSLVPGLTVERQKFGTRYTNRLVGYFLEFSGSYKWSVNWWTFGRASYCPWIALWFTLWDIDLKVLGLFYVFFYVRYAPGIIHWLVEDLDWVSRVSGVRTWNLRIWKGFLEVLRIGFEIWGFGWGFGIWWWNLVLEFGSCFSDWIWSDQVFALLEKSMYTFVHSLL